MPFGWAVALGAANYVNRRVQEKRESEAQTLAADEAEARLRRKADDAAAYGTLELMKLGKDKEFLLIPDYSTGGTKQIALNQYTTTPTTTLAMSPDPDLAWYNALSTKENKIDGSKHRFVAINPNLTPQVLKTGKFEDGTPVVANTDYILFENVAPTKGERATSGISNWRNKILESQDGLKLALAQARDGNNTALNKIMGIGSDLVVNWQKDQRPQEVAAGNAVFEANPFGETGPLAFMKDHAIFQDKDFFTPFMSTVAEQTQYEFLNSLNELGYDVPINNPVTHTLDGKAVTVKLTGSWDDLMVPVEGSRRGAKEWGSEFQNTIGSWAQRGGRSNYEWMMLLNNTGAENGRVAYDRLKEFEAELAALGQPVDFTSGRPVYRESWGNAVKDKFRNLLNELDLKGEDAAAVVGALMPQDLYKGMRTRAYNVTKSAHYFIDPGMKIDELRAEKGDLERNVRLASQIQSTIPAGTGLTADLKSLQAGAADQLRQLGNMFGTNPEGIRGTLLDTFRGFFTDDELDPENLEKLNADDLQLKLRKFAVIQLMYSFAKGMGGSGSDRLSDQDAKNALEALQTSGLLNTQKGMNIVMEALMGSMERRLQVLGGLTSSNEREIIGGLFIADLHKGRAGFEFSDVIMDAWTTAHSQKLNGVTNPATTAPKTRRN